TAGNASVTISWTASATATSYSVRRSTENGGPYTQVASVTSTSVADASLANGSTYYYVVVAINAAGESPNSTQVSASPAAPVQQAVLVILPATAVVNHGGVVQFSAAITGMDSQAISWSIQETSSAGTLTTSGRYTAPQTTGIYHVVAASATNANVKAVATVQVQAPSGTVPNLTPGQWTNITPPVSGLSSTFGTTNIEVSPVNPDVIYVTTDTLGLWRTTDRGSNWT